MTTIDGARTSTRTERRSGVLTVVRLNRVGVGWRVGWPWIIIAAAFVVLGLLLVLGPPGDRDMTTGVLVAVYIAAAVGFLQTMTQTFGFALSLGITRRDFYLGTGLVVLAESLLHAVAMTVLLRIEQATDGFGIGLRIFGIGFLVQDGLLTQVAAYAGPLVGASFVAILAGTVFQRWGQTGMFVAGLALLLVSGGLAVLGTWLQWWPAVGAFVEGTPTLLLVAVLPTVLGLLAAVAGYLLVRRAIP